jgi:hypothetical protein
MKPDAEGEYDIGDGKKTKKRGEAFDAYDAKANKELGIAAPAPGSDMVSQIGAGLSDAIKSAFGEEIKIQTATIENLTIGAGAAQLAAGGGASAADRPIAAGPGQSGEISGTVQIAGDLRTAIINIVRSQSMMVDVPLGFGATIVGQV